MSQTDYTTFTDQALLDLINPSINLGGIPFKAVQEVQRRGLKKYVTRTLHTNDFDAEGNFIGED